MARWPKGVSLLEPVTSAHLPTPCLPTPFPIGLSPFGASSFPCDNRERTPASLPEPHLSNQVPHLNQNAWNNLEKYSRSLTRTYQNVYVCTGPLFLPR